MNTPKNGPSVWLNWLAALSTVALVVTYELVQRWRHQHAPAQHAPWPTPTCARLGSGQ